MTLSESTNQKYAALREAAEHLLSKSWTTFNPSSDQPSGDLQDSQIILKSPNQEVVYLSPDLKSRFFADDDLASIDEAKLLGDTSLDLLANADRRTLERGQSLTLTFCTKDAGGQDVRLVSHRIPLHGPDNQPIGILASYSEVSADKEQPAKGQSAIDLNQLMATFETLDERDRDMAKLLSRGAINKQLAGHFNVSVRSIENWRRALLNKLNAETIADLTRIVVRFEDFGLMSPPNADS